MSSVLFVSEDSTLIDRVRLCLPPEEWRVDLKPTPIGLLGYLYSNPVDAVILDLNREPPSAFETVLSIKRDFYFNLIPLLVFLPAGDLRNWRWADCPVDDYLRQEQLEDELLPRLRLSLDRIQRVLDNNPLSRLPGNTSIQRAVSAAIGKSQAVCYIDISNFKPFNDRFGFSRGDEIIRMLARVAANSVRAAGRGAFIGHIGGDDFVFVVTMDQAMAISKAIVDGFDGLVAGFFDQETQQRGSYSGVDRSGVKRDIAIPALAIAIVPADLPGLDHFAQIAEAAATLNKRPGGAGSRVRIYGEVDGDSGSEK